MIYRYTIHANGDETWSPVSGTDCYEGVVSNVGQVILEKGSGFSFADWRDKAWEQYNGIRRVIPAEENNSLYSAGAIKEAYDFIAEERRMIEAQQILERVFAWGEDEYAAGTVFRFSKVYDAPRVTGSYARENEYPKTFTCAALKAENGQWYTTESARYDWEGFVKFLVTDGHPIAKTDVEIFPPAVFRAEAGTEVKTEITGVVQ